MMLDVVQAVEDTCNDLMSTIHTAMPAVVVKYESGRIDAKISGKYYLEGTAYDYPLITGCPVIAGGGIAYPINVGDACLLIFTEQSLSEWITGTNTNNNEKWSLTNAVAICGLNKSETALQKTANSTGTTAVGDLTGTGNINVPNGEVSVQGTNVKTSIDAIEDDIDELDERVADVEASTEEISGTVTELGTRVATAEASVTALGTRVSTAEASITNLSTNKEDKGHLTIGGTQYTIRVTTTDAGQAGYITFVVEA